MVKEWEGKTRITEKEQHYQDGQEPASNCSQRLREKCRKRASGTFPNAPPVSEFAAQVLLLQGISMIKTLQEGDQSRAKSPES